MVGVACAESRSRFSEEISAFSESIFFYASLPTSTPTFRLMHRSLLSISSFACSKYSFVLLTSTSFALASVSFAALAGGRLAQQHVQPHRAARGGDGRGHRRVGGRDEHLERLVLYAMSRSARAHSASASRDRCSAASP